MPQNFENPTPLSDPPLLQKTEFPISFIPLDHGQRIGKKVISNSFPANFTKQFAAPA